MKEGVHPGLGVRLGLVGDSVDHSAGASGSGDLAGIQHIQGECVIGLVAGPVGDRSALGYAGDAGCTGAHAEFSSQ